MLILHLLTLTQKVKGDYFAGVVLVAVATLLFFYSSINIAMTIGFFPVVGVPLPLFSHGGTSFITFITLFAIIENLLSFRFNFMFSSK
jgi:rod shape determining protein RodA